MTDDEGRARPAEWMEISDLKPALGLPSSISSHGEEDDG